MNAPVRPAARPDLLPAFDAWCAHQRQVGRLRRGSSEAVYRAMWQPLASWCDARSPPVRLADLDARTVALYLAGRTGLVLPDGDLTPRYRARLTALVRRVQMHRIWLRQQSRTGGEAAASPSAPALLSARPAPATAVAPPLHLGATDAQQLEQLLRQVETPPGTRWQTWRDRCAAALQLGAGLGPGELRALRLADVISAGGPQPGQPWQLRVAASGSAPVHVAALAPWAGAVLGRWIALRQAESLGGPWLLPSTRSGKPWGKVAQYEAARRVFADAGLDPDGGGSFRLRHSFALRQLQHGHDEALVARWLGVVDPAVMQRYRPLLDATTLAGGTAAAATVDAARRGLPQPV